AKPGYTFDFSGGVDTTQKTVGTSSITGGGFYTGSTNEDFTVTMLGSGTIGVTPGLQARVTDSNGAVVATLDIGSGYETGQPLAIKNGATISLAAGNVSTGNAVTISAIGDPDSANILTALGINTLFAGGSASTIEVNREIVDDPNRLATSRSRDAGDSTNLQRMTSLRDLAVMDETGQSLAQFSNQIVTDVGTDVATLIQQQDTNSLLTDRVKQEQQGVSGVDTNEEMVELLKYQRLFQMASRYISTLNETYAELMNVI
ncbi:MAG: hypothetical protein FJ267_18230, partial [Planctomycetes bacterium]|nr:hypothetical protein [Planctomycetota bacterium]